MVNARNWFIIGGALDFAVVLGLFFLVLKIINKYDPFLKQKKKKKKKKTSPRHSNKPSIECATNYVRQPGRESTKLAHAKPGDHDSTLYLPPTETSTLLLTSSMSSERTSLLRSNPGKIPEYTKDNEMLTMTNLSSKEPSEVVFTEKKWLEFINSHRKEFDDGSVTFTTVEELQESFSGKKSEQDTDEQKHIQFFIDVIKPGSDFPQSQEHNKGAMFQLFTRSKGDKLFAKENVEKQVNSVVLSTGLVPTLLRNKKGNITLDKIKDVLKASKTSDDKAHKICVVQNVDVVFSGYDGSNNTLKRAKEKQLISAVVCDVCAGKTEKTIEAAYRGAYLAAVDSGYRALFLTFLEAGDQLTKVMYNAVWNGLKEIVMNSANQKVEEVHLIAYEASGELATFCNFLSTNGVDVKINK